MSINTTFSVLTPVPDSVFAYLIRWFEKNQDRFIKKGQELGLQTIHIEVVDGDDEPRLVQVGDAAHAQYPLVYMLKKLALKPLASPNPRKN